MCEQCFELEPDLGVLVVDFMSTDFAGHLGYARLDPQPSGARSGRGRRRARAGVRGRRRRLRAPDRGGPRALLEEPTVLMMSDHGMKPMYWVFHLNRWLEEHGHLRYRRRSLQRLRGTRLRALAGLDQRLARTSGLYTRLLDALPFVPAVAARPRVRRHRLPPHPGLLVRDRRPGVPGRVGRRRAATRPTPSALPPSSRPSATPRRASRCCACCARPTSTTAPTSTAPPT